MGRSAFGPSSAITDIAPLDSSAPASARPTSPSSTWARPLPASITYGTGSPGRVVTGVRSASNVLMLSPCRACAQPAAAEAVVVR